MIPFSCAKLLKTIDFRVLMTIPMGWKENALYTYKNHPRYIYIMHHGLQEGNDRPREILTWGNSYLLGELASMKGKVPSNRTFTPFHLPIFPRKSSFSSSSVYTEPSGCSRGKLPIAIIQGALSPTKRDLKELETIMQVSEGELQIKVLTRHPPYAKWLSNEDPCRVQWLQSLNMTAFHEAFQDAAFLLAGMSPLTGQHYFKGHPSSNIAYALHFGLQVIGHEAISVEYTALKGKGFWHNGSQASIAMATQQAIAAWQSI